MTVKEALQYDIKEIRKMKRSELSQVVQVLASAANKRIKRLESSDIGTLAPAYTAWKESGKGFFKVGGKDQGQLQSEWSRVRRFLDAKTSSLSKFTNVREATYKRLNLPKGMREALFPTKEEEKEFWAGYRKFASLRPELHKEYGSDETQQLLISLYADFNIDVAISMLEDLTSENYKKKEGLRVLTNDSFGQEWYDFLEESEDLPY